MILATFMPPIGRAPRLPVVALMVLALGAGDARAGPITFNTALPVFPGEFIVRGQAKLIRSRDDSGPMNRDLRVWAAPTVLVYGATRRATLFGIVPYLDKNLKVDTPLGRRQRMASGFGDVTLLGRYTVIEQNRAGETLRLAPFVGLKLPTGSDNERDSLGPLPRPLQTGSGSWDPLVGVIFTRQTLDWEFDASASYKLNTQADGYTSGDQAEWDLSCQRRVWPREIGGGVPGFLYLVIESNLLWTARDRFAGQRVADSGGTTWFLAPGIQYVTRRYVLETVVQIPVVQDLNGLALENDFVLTAGFRMNF